MKPLSILALVMIATPAAADPGHIAEVAGHAHWVAVAAAGAAAALAAAVAARRGKARDNEPEAETDDAAESVQ